MEEQVTQTASTQLDKDTSPLSESQSKRKQFLLSLPQPILVLGSMLAVASAYAYQWFDAEFFTVIMIILPLPLILIAERIWTKRQDWILTPKEFAEDAFWLATSGLIWVPFYSNFYKTPISEGFKALRDASPLNFELKPESMLGLILAAILLRTLVEFIYYWLHRMQHKFLFWWRIHATHHHITKMGAARSDRTHPLEFLALMVGSPIILALAGASDAVIAVSGAFNFMSAYLNHSNLPLRSGIYG
ncbi:MAG: sterol desaturase/sphingolipid hydroxylase (fatty acid hydroxylase superfamily), partial [Paraglaciecola sp.]